jgi:succinate dehydrogenase / fumarate reductase flavoprotein subunit
MDEMEVFFRRPSGVNPYDLHKQLNQCMSTYVGIFREEADLQAGLKKLAEIKAQANNLCAHGSKAFNPGWHMCRDLKNMITASEAIAMSALSRKESRGAHSRIDFPKLDEELGKANTSVFAKDGKMALEKTPLPEMPKELKDLFAKKEPAHA